MHTRKKRHNNTHRLAARTTPRSRKLTAHGTQRCHHTHTAASDSRRTASDSGQVLPIAMAVLLIVALFLTGESLVLFAKSRETRQKQAEALAVDTVDAAVAHINNIVATHHKLDKVVDALIPYAQRWHKFTGHEGCAKDDPNNNTTEDAWVAQADMCWRIYVPDSAVDDDTNKVDRGEFKKYILKFIKNRTGQDVRVIELDLDVKAGCQIHVDVLPRIGTTSVEPFAPRCDTSDTVKLRYAQRSFLNYLLHYDEPTTPPQQPDPDADPPDPDAPPQPGRWGPPTEGVVSFHYLDSISGPIHTNRDKVHICARQTDPNDPPNGTWGPDEKVKNVFGQNGADVTSLTIEVATTGTPYYQDQCNRTEDDVAKQYSVTADTPLTEALAPKASPKLTVYYPATASAAKQGEGVTCSTSDWLAAAEQQAKAGTQGWVNATAIDPANLPKTVGYVKGWVEPKPELPPEGKENLLDIQITNAAGQTTPHVEFVNPRQASQPTSSPIQVVWSDGDLIIPIEGVFEESITFIAKENIILEAGIDTLIEEALPAIYDLVDGNKIPAPPAPYKDDPSTVPDVLLKSWVGSKMGTQLSNKLPPPPDNQSPPVVTFIAGCDVFITFKRPLGYIHLDEDVLTPDIAKSLEASQPSETSRTEFHDYVKTVTFTRKGDLLNKIIREIAALDTIAEWQAIKNLGTPPNPPTPAWQDVAAQPDPLSSSNPTTIIDKVNDILDNVVARCLKEPPRQAPTPSAQPYTEPADPHVSGGDYERMKYDGDVRRLCSFMSVALENVAILAPAGGIKAGARNVKHGDWEICHYPCQIEGLGSNEDTSQADSNKTKLAYQHLPTISISGSIATRYRGLFGQYYIPPPLENGETEVESKLATGYRKVFSYPNDFAQAEPSWWPDIQQDKWVPVAISGSQAGG